MGSPTVAERCKGLFIRQLFWPAGVVGFGDIHQVAGDGHEPHVWQQVEKIIRCGRMAHLVFNAPVLVAFGLAFFLVEIQQMIKAFCDFRGVAGVVGEEGGGVHAFITIQKMLHGWVGDAGFLLDIVGNIADCTRDGFAQVKVLAVDNGFAAGVDHAL